MIKNIEQEMREAARVLDFERAAQLRDMILEELEKNHVLEKFKHVYTTDAGAVISTHCGPSCIGILFIKEK